MKSLIECIQILSRIRCCVSDANNTPRILLSAFGMHSGGALTLLKALTLKLDGKVKLATLDSRVRDLDLLSLDASNVMYVRKSFLARILSLLRLSSKATSTDVLLCFNSLPPFWKLKSRVIIYVHAPHFVNMHLGIQYTLLTTLRIWIERYWFLLGIRHCSEVWVQTSTMVEQIRLAHPKIIVRLMPFIDDDLADKLSASSIKTVSFPCQTSEFIFFYPAEFVGHKNHLNLLKAWLILQQEGFFPKLWLTLESHEIASISAAADMDFLSINAIENLGRIRRDEVLSRITLSSAIIFPSLAETFGLPMLEARGLGKPILASEKDFVRDVCNPSETFDPASPRSISNAVLRFMRQGNAVLPITLNAEEFITMLLK